jgi:hypothetical protein
MRQARLALALFVVLPLAAQQPAFRGATVTTIRATGDLRRQIVSLGTPSESVWAGYNVPLPQGRHIEVGCSYRCGFCSLDDENISISSSTDGDDLSTPVAVLYRVRDGAINRIRAFSSCAIEASGAKIYWMEGVDPQASISMLEAMAKSDDPMSKKAVFALSLHGGATDALIELAHHAERSHVRSDALFWLAQTAAAKAAGALRESVDNDPDDEVRRKAVFAISQLPNDQSIPLLVDLMRTHRSREVRKKAAFWLGQKDDPRALSAIESFLRQ